MTKLSPFMPRRRPSNVSLDGKYITLETIDWAKHGAPLSQNITGPENSELWSYIPLGPFDDLTGLALSLAKPCKKQEALQRRST